MYDLNSILLKIIEVQNKTVQKLNGVIVYKLPDNATLAGNQFNGIKQLVKTNQNGLIPSSLYNIQYIIAKVQQSINSNGSGSGDSGEITESDIVSLLSLPRAISKYTDEHIGEIISIPYTDASGTISGPIEFEVVAVNHHKDINNESKPTITLMSKNILRHAVFDAKEPNNPLYDEGYGENARANYGNNRWSVSNIRQWLNSNGASNEWFIAQHEYDEAPTTDKVQNESGAYADDPGFLAGFSDEIKQHFATVRNKTVLCNVDKSLLSKDFEETEDKVFLPSYTEMGYEDLDSNNPEGSHITKFNGDGSRINTGANRYYWMRSPLPDFSSTACIVYGGGSSDSGDVYDGICGVAPLLVLC